MDIDHCTCADLLNTLRVLTEAQRKKAAASALAQWKDGQAKHPYDRWLRLLIVLTATAPDAKKALAIPVRHGSFEYGVGWSPKHWLVPAPAEPLAALTEVAIGRGPAWCADYLNLILDAKKPRPAYIDVVLLIARAHQLTLPATPIAAHLWATWFSTLLPSAQTQGEAYRRSIARLRLESAGGGWVVHGHDDIVESAAAALRNNPNSESQLLALFDHADAVGAMVGRYSSQQDMDDTADIISELVGDGTVDPRRLASQAIAALSRSDAVASQRLQARLLEVARPDSDLIAQQARLLVNLLATSNVTPAALAQALLRRADADRGLSDDLFVDACQMVFSRKEKGLRAVQLAWVHQRLAQTHTLSSGAAGLTAALFCPDHGVQSEAASALQSVWTKLGADQRAAYLSLIEAAQGVLDAALYRRLWESCTGSQSTVAPAPEEIRPPLRTGLDKQPFQAANPAELPTDVLLALQTYHGQRDALAHERAVVAVFDALAAGQAEQARRIVDKIGVDKPFSLITRWTEQHCGDLSCIAWARMDELHRVVQADQRRAFISRPSWSHGAISPEHLIERLVVLARDGESALPVDFLLALLRTEPCSNDDVAQLRSIGSAQALAAADFLAAGGAAQLQTRWLVIEAEAGRTGARPTTWGSSGQREVCVALAPVAQRPAIAGAPMDWAAGFEPSTAPFASEFDAVPAWIAPMLPTNAEALAALHLWGFRRACMEYGTDGGKNVAVKLPEFLRAHGQAGPALHLAVLFAMSGNDAPVRLAGSDGLITLLQQERWRADLAAMLVGECIRCRSVKPGRLAASLMQVREAGEAVAVWSLVRAAIAAALPLDPVPTATADLLALAAELAGALRIGQPINELDAIVAAIDRKPNKLQFQAQRLQAVLSGAHR